MIAWTCGECQAKNPASAEGRFCRACGSPRNASLAGEARSNVIEFRPPWRQPDFRPSKPEDRCTEPGCTKTVRDHIEEFRAIANRPDTVFSRPSRREMPKDVIPDEDALEARRQMLARQAEQLRREAARPDDEVPF